MRKLHIILLFLLRRLTQCFKVIFKVFAWLQLPFSSEIHRHGCAMSSGLQERCQVQWGGAPNLLYSTVIHNEGRGQSNDKRDLWPNGIGETTFTYWKKKSIQVLGSGVNNNWPTDTLKVLGFLFIGISSCLVKFSLVSCPIKMFWIIGSLWVQYSLCIPWYLKGKNVIGLVRMTIGCYSELFRMLHYKTRN